MAWWVCPVFGATPPMSAEVTPPSLLDPLWPHTTSATATALADADWTRGWTVGNSWVGNLRPTMSGEFQTGLDMLNPVKHC